jgi:hypothetical protein
MALYNGTLSFRIWVIGTHRMLRVVDEAGDNVSDVEKLPKALATRLTADHGSPADFLNQEIIGDFRVCDFTRSKPGVMQSVTLANADHIRITANP